MLDLLVQSWLLLTLACLGLLLVVMAAQKAAAAARRAGSRVRSAAPAAQPPRPAYASTSR